MELRQLEYFVICANEGSLTRAAEKLYTTQPHVSMVIKSLEEELKIKLFERKSKGVMLTEDGKRIYRYAGNILKNKELILEASREKEEKWLKIASNPSSHMAALATTFCRLYEKQNIQLQYKECGIERMLELLSEEQYDMGFIFVPENSMSALRQMAERRNLEFISLRKTDLVLHVGPDHPFYTRTSISPKELERLSYIQMEDDFFNVEELLQQRYKNNSEGRELHRVIRTNSDHMMIQMLEEGDICNIGSYWLKNMYKEHNFGCITIDGYQGKISFGYLKHRGKPLKDNAMRFMEMLEPAVEKDSEV